MKTELMVLEEKFIENRDIIKSAFPFESAYLYPACATVFLNAGKTADVGRLRECRALLKSKVNVFSNFRGASEIITVAMLAESEEPEKKLDNAIAAYKCLREHFSAGSFLPLAATLIAKERTASEFPEVAADTRNIYKLMRKEHPLLTSDEDSVFAALIALSGQRASDMITEIERNYRILKEKFFSANAVQSLSHVLSLCPGSADEKCRKTIELFDTLKARKMRYGTEYELAILGVLAMLDKENDYIADRIEEVSLFLSSQKGYGFWGAGKRERLMHAAMLLTSALTIEQNHTLSESTMAVSAQQAAIAAAQSAALIAAQQAAICSMMAAQAASSSASN